MTNTVLMPSQATNNPFSFSSTEIRTAIDENGHVFFGAKDVVTALEMTWRGNLSLKNIPEKWRAIALSATPSGTQETIFINEPALFMLAFRSSKLEAVKFTQWVCEEVLPAIKQQGYYGNIPIKELNTLRYQKIKLLQELVNCRDEFAKAAYITSLRNVCNLLGEPMPDVALLGKKTSQLELGV